MRVGHRRRRLRDQPDLRAAQAQHARPDRRRQQGRHRDGRGGREGSAGGADGPGARARARGDQGDRRRHRRAGGAGRQDQAGRAPKKEVLDRTSSRRSRARSSSRSATRCGSRTSSRTTRRSTRSSSDFVAGLPDDDAGAEGGREVDRQGARRKRSCATRSSSAASGSTAAKFDEIRKITIEVGVLPRTHGSCLFTRGETQALVTATLGTADDQQKVETVDGETWKRFMLHYNFPPFSVGEVKFLRGPGRREIGHGALAERSLAADDAGRRELPLHRAASSPKSSSRTAPRRWRRCAADRWR